MKLDFSVPAPTLAYMRQRFIRQTKRTLINVIVAEQTAEFEKNLRAKVEELLADLTVEEVEAAYNVSTPRGPALNIAVLWNSKRLK